MRRRCSSLLLGQIAILGKVICTSTSMRKGSASKLATLPRRANAFVRSFVQRVSAGHTAGCCHFTHSPLRHSLSLVHFHLCHSLATIGINSSSSISISCSVTAPASAEAPSQSLWQSVLLSLGTISTILICGASLSRTNQKKNN